MIGLLIPSWIAFCAIVALMGLIAVLLFAWQLQVFGGERVPNPDGSFDDWHDQKILYGIALADLLITCPATFLGIGLIFVAPRAGVFILALVAFWFVWINFATTLTSLRFENPRFTGMWFIVFPLGCLVGLAYLIWLTFHFDAIFGS